MAAGGHTGPMADDAIEVWCLPAPHPGSPLPGADWLDAHEQARAARLRAVGGPELYAAAHILVRGMLAALGAGAPGDLIFDRGGGDDGPPGSAKPRLRGGDWCFNLSHSAFTPAPVAAPVTGTGAWGIAACAVTRGREVGLDVEGLGRRIPAALAAHAFGDADRAWLARQADATRAFLTLWTLKEAWIKGVGAGLRLPLPAFHIDPDTGALSRDAARLAPALAGLPADQRDLAGRPWRFARLRLPVMPDGNGDGNGNEAVAGLALGGAGGADVRVRFLPDLGALVGAVVDGSWGSWRAAPLRRLALLGA